MECSDIRKGVFELLFDNVKRKERIPLIFANTPDLVPLFKSDQKIDFYLGWKIPSELQNEASPFGHGWCANGIKRSPGEDTDCREKQRKKELLESAWDDEFARQKRNADVWKIIRSVCLDWRNDVDQIFHFEDYSLKYQNFLGVSILGYAANKGLRDFTLRIMNNKFTTDQSFHMIGDFGTLVRSIIMITSDPNLISLLADDSRANLWLRNFSILRCTLNNQESLGTLIIPTLKKYPQINMRQVSPYCDTRKISDEERIQLTELGYTDMNKEPIGNEINFNSITRLLKRKPTDTFRPTAWKKEEGTWISLSEDENEFKVEWIATISKRYSQAAGKLFGNLFLGNFLDKIVKQTENSKVSFILEHSRKELIYCEQHPKVGGCCILEDQSKNGDFMIIANDRDDKVFLHAQLQADYQRCWETKRDLSYGLEWLPNFDDKVDHKMIFGKVERTSYYHWDKRNVFWEFLNDGLFVVITKHRDFLPIYIYCHDIKNDRRWFIRSLERDEGNYCRGGDAPILEGTTLIYENFKVELYGDEIREYFDI